MNRFCYPSTTYSDVTSGRARSQVRSTVMRRLTKTVFPVAFVFSFVFLLTDLSVSAQQAPRTRPDEAKIDADRLPPGYQPPPEQLAIMYLDLPLTTKDEIKQLKKDAFDKFSKVKIDLDTSAAAQKIIEGSVRMKLTEITLKEEDRKDLPLLHRAFVDTFTNITNPNKKAVDELTRMIKQEIVKQIPELLKNNFYVRLHAVYILSEIDYAPAYELLVHVLQSKDIRVDENEGQPEAVKIAAAMGLIRVLRFAGPNVKERTAIALAVVEELQKPELHWWLQLRLVEALRYCDIAGVDAGNNDRPFVVESLLAAIHDDRRDWRVRARACYAIGRVPFPRSIKPDDVVTAVCEFAVKLSNDAAATPNNPSWKFCFWNVYLAFHASDLPKEKDLDTEKKQAGGLLTRVKSVSQPAYQTIIPIVNDVLNGKSPDAGSLKTLNDFVRKRRADPNAVAVEKPLQ